MAVVSENLPNAKTDQAADIRGLIFLDVDMTIWDHNLIVPESTKKAIALAQKKGSLVFMNSGRSRSNLSYGEITKIPFDGIVAACGGHIEAGGIILKETLVPWPLVQKALSVFRENDVPVVVEGRDLHFINMPDFPNDRYVSNLWKNLGSLARPLSDISEKDAVNKFSVAAHTPSDLKKTLDALSGEFDFVDHNGSVAEIFPKGNSKASGVEYLRRHFDVPPERVYAVGDSINDYEVLSSVKHSIAMGNAVDRIKEIAEYVTTPIDKDGVRNAFAHYGLI